MRGSSAGSARRRSDSCDANPRPTKQPQPRSKLSSFPDNVTVHHAIKPLMDPLFRMIRAMKTEINNFDRAFLEVYELGKQYPDVREAPHCTGRTSIEMGTKGGEDDDDDYVSGTPPPSRSYIVNSQQEESPSGEAGNTLTEKAGTKKRFVQSDDDIHSIPDSSVLYHEVNNESSFPVGTTDGTEKRKSKKGTRLLEVVHLDTDLQPVKGNMDGAKVGGVKSIKHHIR